MAQSPSIQIKGQPQPEVPTLSKPNRSTLKLSRKKPRTHHPAHEVREHTSESPRAIDYAARAMASAHKSSNTIQLYLPINPRASSLTQSDQNFKAQPPPTQNNISNNHHQMNPIATRAAINPNKHTCKKIPEKKTTSHWTAAQQIQYPNLLTNLLISSGVENWRRPVGLPLNFPLPIITRMYYQSINRLAKAQKKNPPKKT